MEVKVNKENGKVTAYLIGRLDTPASQEIAPHMEVLGDYADGTIIIDCKELSYISSSGLRLFLCLRKTAIDKGGQIIIKDINDDIHGVFMMTGFLNLFDIR